MTKEKKNEIFTAFKAAFPLTVPIFAGFWFLGITYGIYMNVLGFSFVYPMFMSMLIFAGSMEFVAANTSFGCVYAATRVIADLNGECPSSFLRYFHA